MHESVYIHECMTLCIYVSMKADMYIFTCIHITYMMYTYMCMNVYMYTCI